MNEELAFHIVEELLRCGVREFCVCPASRNAPLVMALANTRNIKIYYGYEERSSAYFALGRSRLTQRPVAVICTSGTAAGEFLPATMEAHYTGDPLVLVTADRPRRYRGSGAPQSAEQVGIFSHYPEMSFDLEGIEKCDLKLWQQTGPLHLNVCFEEPSRVPFERIFEPAVEEGHSKFEADWTVKFQQLDKFLSQVKNPLVIVSHLKIEARAAVKQFLLNLNAPVYLEAISGLREDAELKSLRIVSSENIWQQSQEAGYPIDGILRIGGVPTIRLWRDLEDLQGKITVCSISEVPFSGLSHSGVIQAPLKHFFQGYMLDSAFTSAADWLTNDRLYMQQLHALMQEEPYAEASLVHALSQVMPRGSHVYLGNSLPIREWDMAATDSDLQLQVTASRGVNGIDGQISTFLGLCRPEVSNWAILGDLTALYDLAAPWFLPQILDMQINLVIINNSGGRIFERMYPMQEFLNAHNYRFDAFANMWKMNYQKWTTIKTEMEPGQNLIELIPDLDASTRFWQKLKNMTTAGKK